MSLIKPALWRAYMGDIPMPEGCTYWQFVAAREVMWAQEDLEWSVAYLAQLRRLKTLPNMEKYQDELDELITNELERIKQ